MEGFNRLIFLLLFSLVCQFFLAQDPWILNAQNIDASKYYGISVSNGMIGIVSSPEPLKTKETILAGIYDKAGRGRTSNILSSFNLLDINLVIDWNTVNVNDINNYQQNLNMKDAVFSESFDYKNAAFVTYSYQALRNLPHNVLLTISIKAHKDLTFTAENTLKIPNGFRDFNQYYNEVNTPHNSIPLMTSVAKTPSGTISVAACNTFIFPEEHYNQPRVMHEMRDTDSHLMKFIKSLKKDETYQFSLIGTLISSVQASDPYNFSERLAVFANLQGADNLVKNHNKEWEKLWKSNIEIEGDPQAQQDIHNMMYHLYSFSRESSIYSVSPMGLSGTGYNGHIFWDAEMYIFPALLVLHPEIARSYLDYRFNKLPQAQKNAELFGYKGAMYPWESASTGEEETPVWALSGTYEHHITGDVAFAVWQYYLVTRDKSWLKEKGWPILKSTAEFWENRVSKINDRYCILNVVGADEWAENVDNDAYTNGVAKQNLLFVNLAAKELGYAENSKWKDIADHMFFSTMENGVTKEFDTYNGQNIKQADVNLLAYPLKLIMDNNQIKKDLEYYEKKIPKKETPAMTKSFFSILYSKLGDSQKAYELFKDSYEHNLLPPFRIMSEMEGSNNPYFLTGAGGVLQAVIMGFGGFDINDKGKLVQTKSILPNHWKKLTIKKNVSNNK